MWFKTILIFFFFSILASDFAFAQKDTTKADPEKFYENLEAYSGRSKFTQFMYRMVFKPTASASKKKKAYKKLIRKPYSAFEGKIIRHINIVTLDPFGNSIADTIVSSQNFIMRGGNKMHIKSQHSTIRNLLLIRQNQVFDSLLVKESERLVRSQPYVRDVSFFILATSKNSDSVDIFIRELDTWSIIPKVVVSGSRIAFNILDGNFLGLGHEFRNIYSWQHTTGEDAFSTNYFIPNIRDTYINSTLNYSTDEHRNFTESISVDRPFFSPLAKWGAGALIKQEYRRDTLHINDSLYLMQKYKFSVQDYWAGNAFQLFKGNTVNMRTTNFISAVRFIRIRFTDKPVEMYDTASLYSNENLYLGSIGISQRKYVQDKFIFNFGLIEDIPIGKVFSLTGGYQERNNTGSLYLGARVAFGNYYSWGYLSSNFEYGTYFRQSHSRQGIFSANIIYFTGLLEIGKWKFREFVKPQLILGINRLSYDSLTLNDGYGLDGFNSPSLSGNSRMIFTMQSQAYAPWNFIGFRFGPFISCSIGMLSDRETGFKNSKVYAKIGVGILIKNDYLVFSTFQLSLAFYPVIPGKGENVFKVNSFRTNDFIIGDYIIGKPAPIHYQ